MARKLFLIDHQATEMRWRGTGKNAAIFIDEITQKGKTDDLGNPEVVGYAAYFANITMPDPSGTNPSYRVALVIPKDEINFSLALIPMNFASQNYQYQQMDFSGMDGRIRLVISELKRTLVPILRKKIIPRLEPWGSTPQSAITDELRHKVIAGLKLVLEHNLAPNAQRYFEMRNIQSGYQSMVDKYGQSREEPTEDFGEDVNKYVDQFLQQHEDSVEGTTEENGNGESDQSDVV